MEKAKKSKVTVQTTIQLPSEKVWELWTMPEHITKWNFASDDWLCPRAENDLRAGGKFSSRMEAKDGSMGFDFSGIYDQVTPNEMIAYTLDDGRKVRIMFTDKKDKTMVTETFEAEETHTIDQQKSGWQSILDNFKKYAESRG